MNNPANHAKPRDAITTRKVEPYVMAADVCAVARYTGCGGWTWYTGSAGWMYRLIVESLLGLRLEVARLRVAPCLPVHPDGLTIYYRSRATVYHIHIGQVSAGDDETSMTVDGAAQYGLSIWPIHDRRRHTVEVSGPVI